MRLSIALVATLIAAGGCGAREQARPTALPIVGPDGSTMLHVSCGEREGVCYQLAGQHCPLGYAITPTGRARGNFLVRCRVPAQPVAYSVVARDSLAPSPYVLQETVQPWPTETLAPSPYRDAPSSAYPPLTPGPTAPAKPPPSAVPPAPAGGGSQDFGY